jgi:radical SAM superfamily enzyme YgiQ (UPF0313 family)
VPNGTATFIAGLCEAYNLRHPSGIRVDWRIFDEHVERALTPELLRTWRADAEAAGEGFVLLVSAVQTNNYARGRDVCLLARSEGVNVVAGGIHLSCHGPSVDLLTSCGVSVGIGEAESYFDEIIEDVVGAGLKPIYRAGAGRGIRAKTSASDIMTPDLTRVPFPQAPRYYLNKFITRNQMEIDTSRGCPFLCTFCSVKNAFGRTVRNREPRELAAWMGAQVRERGIRWFDFTDDNFARSAGHLELLEELARLREVEGLKFQLRLMVDIEATCYVHEDSRRGEATRRFLDLVRRAGVAKVHIGIETTTDEALKEVKKNVNRARHVGRGDEKEKLIERYRVGVDAWHQAGVAISAIIMIGLESNDRNSGVEGAKDLVAIGVDYGHFVWIMPFPGADNYAQAVRTQSILNRDFNAFCTEPVTKHPTLAPDDLVRLQDEGTREFYSPRNIVRRSLEAVLGIGRPPVANRLEYTARQVYPLFSSLGRVFAMRTVSGGLFRRSGEYSAPRMAVTDEEARRYYLPGVKPRRVVPESMLDEGSMDSLPLLMRHFEPEERESVSLRPLRVAGA